MRQNDSINTCTAFRRSTVLFFLLFASAPQTRTVASAQPVATQQAAAKLDAANHMVYDAGQGRMVLLISSTQSGFEEIWRWNGKQWALVPGSGPAARELSGAVYDTRRKRIVLHGGIVGPTGDRKGDTWEWDGTNWHHMTDTGVGTRDHHAMAFDEARGKTVLFGGAKSDNSLATDTWEWDGVKWTQVATQGPGGRAHFAMVYDNKRKKVVLFGGIREDGKKYNDTWAWDGKTWEKLSAEGPLPRYRHRMAFDSHAGVMILYGGLGAKHPPGALDDTWIWDGQQWKEIKTAGPGKRNSHVMANDPVRRRIVLCGGSFWDGQVSKIYDDTWEWDGQQWTQIKSLDKKFFDVGK